MKLHTGSVLLPSVPDGGHR